MAKAVPPPPLMTPAPRLGCRLCLLVHGNRRMQLRLWLRIDAVDLGRHAGRPTTRCIRHACGGCDSRERICDGVAADRR